MTKGYPAKSGVYWARVYRWNGNTNRYDLPDDDWYCVDVNAEEDEFFYHGNDVPEELTHIYEYKRVKNP
jgi:hypothetical protein